MTHFEPERELTLDERRLWKRFIESADWLTPFDAVSATVFCIEYAAYLENPEGASVERMEVLRELMNDLGLSPLSRLKIRRGTFDDPAA